MGVQRNRPQTMMQTLVGRALKEDLGEGDITVKALVPPRLRGHGRIIAKQAGVLFGLEPARMVFEKVDSRLDLKSHVPDGCRVQPGDEIMAIQGRVASLLRAERTALNFLQHLSGIATLTARFVEAVKDTNTRILDTRKTTPGLRALEKAAVKAGGGENHRIGLYDMILIKDNHLAMVDRSGELKAVTRAVTRALEAAPPGMEVEVEVTSLEAALEAGRCGAHKILLDNMTLCEMAETVLALKNRFKEKRPETEASGGITLEKVRAVAATGVDRISIGALTHSAPALDIAMYIGFDK